METTLIKKQTQQHIKLYSEAGEDYKIVLEIRHDDSCGNGHNTFAMTADIYAKKWSGSAWKWCGGGCQHEEIKRHFPKYRQLIKWHLCSADQPMHYVANTLYHAGDRDAWGKRKGEPRSFEVVIKFGEFPITYNGRQEFIKWIRTKRIDQTLEIQSIEHKNSAGDNFKFNPKWTFKGYCQVWHECPFDTKREALEFKTALECYTVGFLEHPTAWGEGKEPDLEAARNSAIWPDATLEQLTNRKTLEARLPALMATFKAEIESIGMKF